MPNQNDIRQQITDQIIAALESGSVPPWKRPWRLGKNAGAHANVVSRRNYKGLNPILLDLASEKHGFSSKWWGTFNQWRQLGGRVMPRPDHVPPGKFGTQIVFWSPTRRPSGMRTAMRLRTSISCFVYILSSTSIRRSGSII